MVESIERADGHRVISDLSEARDKIANLERALVSSRRIGAAIGVLMAHCQVTYDQAFALLCEASHVTHRKVRELAEEVLLTGTLHRPASPASPASPGGQVGDTGDGPALR